MIVRNILKRKGPEVITVFAEKTVREAVDILVRNNIGALLVLNQEGKIVGIISERDVLRLTHKDPAGLDTTRIEEIMTTDVIIGGLDDGVAEAERVMTQNHIRHLPIIDRKRLVGMVSIGDLVKAQMSEHAVENRHLRDFIDGKYPA